MGSIVLLLAGARILTSSSQLESAPAWEEGDVEGVDQVLATDQARVTPSGTVATVTAAVLPLAAPSLEATTNLPTPEAAALSGDQPNALQGESTASGGLGERLISGDMAGVPLRIVIPSIGLDAPVVEAKTRKVLLQGDVFEQWVPPHDRVAGWITTSARLGEIGNTVIAGHHNEYGEVFGNLVDVNVGDIILVYSRDWAYSYRVTNRMILQEQDVPIEQRMENARWIGRSTDERLTLVTCWPKESNTHRLILVASPN